MGWIAYTRGGEILREETHGRPVKDGEDGKLLVIAQEDYGHNIAVDLVNGIIAIDYEHLGFQNGTLELAGDKVRLWICEETNISAEMMHLEQKEEFLKDEFGRMTLQDGKFVKVRTDYLTPLTWRPIWFSRVTNGIPTKVIGAQTTLPKEMGGRNVKKLLSIFPDGRLGID
jgi:hypothetical protein